MAKGEDEKCNDTFKEYHEYRLFADVLVNRVMLKVSPSYRIMSDAISIIVSKIEKCCITTLYEWRDKIEMSSSNFMELADGLELQNLISGFNGRSFLIHCATITCLAVIFYNNGVSATPKLLKHHIVNFLKNTMTADGWNAVLEAAQEFVKNRY